MLKRPASFLKLPESMAKRPKQTTLSFAPPVKPPPDDEKELAKMGVTIHRGFLDSKEANELYQEMAKKDFWHAPLPYKNKEGQPTKMKRAKIIYGRESKAPNGSLGMPFYGFPYVDQPVMYPSERKYCAEYKEAPALVQKVWDKMAKMSEFSMNQIMFTHYENGKAGIPHHSDKTWHLTQGAPILDLILGPAANRPFVLQDPTTKKEWKLIPSSGDVIVLTFDANSKLTHAVPEDAKVKEPRISAVGRSVESLFDDKSRAFVYDASQSKKT